MFWVFVHCFAFQFDSNWKSISHTIKEIFYFLLINFFFRSTIRRKQKKIHLIISNNNVVTRARTTHHTQILFRSERVRVNFKTKRSTAMFVKCMQKRNAMLFHLPSKNHWESACVCFEFLWREQRWMRAFVRRNFQMNCIKLLISNTIYFTKKRSTSAMMLIASLSNV